MEVKAWIGNLGMYNEGVLMGEWVTLPIDEEEQNELFKRIGMDYVDEDGELVKTGYEEYYIGDYDSDYTAKLNMYDRFGTYTSIEYLNEFAEKLEDWEWACHRVGHDPDILLAAISQYSSDLEGELDGDPGDWTLRRDIKSLEEYGKMLVYEYNSITLSDDAAIYFDFELYGKDQAKLADGTLTDYGWLERL